jgi:hypothetical protein
MCCGIISSTKNDYACAKDNDDCNIISHSKKHESVLMNHVYILMQSTTPTAGLRFYNPSDLKEEVHKDDLEIVSDKVSLVNKDLKDTNANVEDVIVAFKSLISDIIESKYKEFSKLEDARSKDSSKTDKNVEDAPDFKDKIDEMLTAQEFVSLGDKNDEESDSTVPPRSFPKDLNVDTNVDVESENKLSILSPIYSNTIDRGNEKMLQSQSSTTKRAKSIFSRVGNRINQSLDDTDTSDRFVHNLASSTDQGVKIMKDFYQKVLDLEQYCKEPLTNDLKKLKSKNEEINESIDVLLNPSSLMPRIADVELSIDSHEELLNEIFDDMENMMDRKIQRSGDSIWKMLKPRLRRDSNSLLKERRAGILDNDLVEKNWVLRDQVDDLRLKHRTMDIEGQALKRESKELKVLVGKLSDTLDALVLKCTALEAKVNSSIAVADTSGAGNQGSSTSSSSDQLAKLEYQVTLIESRMGQSTLEFGNITLQSYQDTVLFTNDNIKSNSFGCFFDLMALLNSPRDTNIDEKTFLESLHNAQKTKFLSISEVSTSTSFLHITPLCFCKASQQDVTLIHGSVDKMLPLVRKRHQWSQQGGVFGIKRSLEMNILSKVNSLEHEIRNTLGDSEGASLAKEFLRASYACFNDFINWTENFYNELLAMKSVTESEAWNLILECWMAFFIELRKIRMECSSLSLAGLDVTSDRRKSIVARYIWTMGKAIQLQNEFREKQFRNHSSISAVINYYLFQHKVPLTAYTTAVDKIKDDIKHLNSWRTTATRDITKCLNR